MNASELHSLLAGRPLQRLFAQPLAPQTVLRLYAGSWNAPALLGVTNTVRVVPVAYPDPTPLGGVEVCSFHFIQDGSGDELGANSSQYQAVSIGGSDDIDAVLHAWSVAMANSPLPGHVLRVTDPDDSNYRLVTVYTYTAPYADRGGYLRAPINDADVTQLNPSMAAYVDSVTPARGRYGSRPVAFSAGPIRAVRGVPVPVPEGESGVFVPN